MSDKPLFQDADEQEATYAPQQTSDGADQDAPPLVVPAAGVLGGGLSGATGPAAGSVGTGVPAVAGAALEGETNDARTAAAGATSPGAVSDTDDTN